MAEPFNAAEYLVGRRIAAGDGARVAINHPRGRMTYAELDAEVKRVAAGLRALGVRPEERVLACMTDDVELFTAILAIMHIGAVAVPSSTMLTGPELAKLVLDSRARVLLGSQEFAGTVLTAAAGAPDLRHVVLTGEGVDGVPDGVTGLSWQQLLVAGESDPDEPYITWDESPALWLYTSGTTGTPKGAMHRHADIRYVCETYGMQVLGIGPDDVCLSAAKLFFAYGLGNSMLFPLSVGASAVLEPNRPNPVRFAELTARYRVTLFFAGPSFFSPMLGSDIAKETLSSVRNGVSAGEALPARIFDGMQERFGIEVLDGIGSTEALHIFLSNRPGQAVASTSGVPVPGYEIELRRPDGSVIEGSGEPGMLYIAGDSICTGYWCRTEVNRTVFQGAWMRTGDQYVRNTDGTYTCLGRADDVLKVGGIWVSPAEVEARLLDHPGLAEAVVVGVKDADGLDKPVAVVVPKPGVQIDPDEVIAFCREGMASFKRPRSVLEVGELPKTATGKIQRFRLREMAGEMAADTTETPPTR